VNNKLLRVFSAGVVTGVVAGIAGVWHREHVADATSATNPGSLIEGEVGAAPSASLAAPRPDADAKAPTSIWYFKKPEKTVESGLRFLLFWAFPLLAVAALSGWLSYHTWSQGFASNDKPPHSDGGIIIFDTAPLGSSITATIDATVEPTGFPGTSLLKLTLNFQNASPGLRWFIAASGDYRPKASTPIAAFCPGGALGYRTGRATIACRNSQFFGSQDVSYNSADHIGALDGRTVVRISDSLDGYIDGDTTIISGILTGMDLQPTGNILSTEIIVPISTRLPVQIGSDNFFSYPPIAIVDQGDFGTGLPLGKVTTLHPRAFFADGSTKLPVDYLPVTSLSLDIDLGTQINQLNWASPPTARSDQLRWHVRGQGIQTVKFSLHNPFFADRLSRNSIFAGIYLSLATSALLLLLERFIEWLLRRSRS
jgi:hypothetical protein